MRAVLYDGKVRFRNDYPIPVPPAGWALIKVLQAGICGTDMEIIRGYKGFKGVMGHEFVGIIERCDNPAWMGKRVVGEINVGCGKCTWCMEGPERHCPDRKVLGIRDLDGCMADYCILPFSNLLEVPDDMPSDCAVLIEPLSAACEILDQCPIKGSERAVVLGDGTLGILCSWVLGTEIEDMTLVGHHPGKLMTARFKNIKTAPGIEKISAEADIVVDATGSHSGIGDAMRICRPRGTIVLKTTVASIGEINLAPIVVKEINLQGSRCGRFKDALRILESHPDMPLDRLVSEKYRIAEAEHAFRRASYGDMLKVLIDFQDNV